MQVIPKVFSVPPSIKDFCGIFTSFVVPNAIKILPVQDIERAIVCAICADGQPKVFLYTVWSPAVNQISQCVFTSMVRRTWTCTFSAYTWIVARTSIDMAWAPIHSSYLWQYYVHCWLFFLHRFLSQTSRWILFVGSKRHDNRSLQALPWVFMPLQAISRSRLGFSYGPAWWPVMDNQTWPPTAGLAVEPTNNWTSFCAIKSAFNQVSVTQTKKLESQHNFMKYSRQCL